VSLSNRQLVFKGRRNRIKNHKSRRTHLGQQLRDVTLQAETTQDFSRKNESTPATHCVCREGLVAPAISCDRISELNSFSSSAVPAKQAVKQQQFLSQEIA